MKTESLPQPAGETPQEAVQRLQAQHAAGELSREQLVAALGAIHHPDAAEVLSRLQASATGALRREIRQALFRLKQRGILPAAEPPVRKEHSRIAQASETLVEGFLSTVDAEGVRVTWLVKDLPQGGVRRMLGVVSETKGLLGVVSERMSRRALVQERKGVEERARSPVIQIEWRLADFILCDAYRHTAQDERLRVGNFFQLRGELLSSPPPEEFAHPVYSELGVSGSEAIPDETTGVLELARLRLPPERIAEYAREFTELSSSRLVLSAHQQRERLEPLLAKAVSEIFQPEFAYRLRRRMEDTAYYLARTGERDTARRMAIIAARLREPARLAEEPFFRTWVAAELSKAEQSRRAGQSADTDVRLIVTPEEVARTRWGTHS